MSNCVVIQIAVTFKAVSVTEYLVKSIFSPEKLSNPGNRKELNIKQQASITKQYFQALYNSLHVLQ